MLLPFINAKLKDDIRNVMTYLLMFDSNVGKLKKIKMFLFFYGSCFHL